jgi:hypothetical protein
MSSDLVNFLMIDQIPLWGVDSDRPWDQFANFRVDLPINTATFAFWFEEIIHDRRRTYVCNTPNTLTAMTWIAEREPCAAGGILQARLNCGHCLTVVDRIDYHQQFTRLIATFDLQLGQWSWRPLSRYEITRLSLEVAKYFGPTPDIHALQGCLQNPADLN